MKSGFRKRQFSLFSKILLVFFIVVFPLYVISIQINILGQNDVRKEIAESTQSRISFYLTSLERDFNNLIAMQSSLVNNENLQAVIKAQPREEDFQQQKSLNTLRDKLVELKDMNPYISEVSIYIPGIDKKISNRSITSIPAEEFEFLKTLTGSENFPFSTGEGQVYINITPDLYSMASEKNGRTDYIISVKVSQSRLESVLKQFTGNEQGHALLIGDKRGLSIGGEASGSLLPYLTGFLGGQPSDRKSGIGSMRTPMGKYIVAYENSTRLHSTLMVCVPEEKLLETLTRYKVWFWVLSALTVAMVVLFTLWIRSMIINPLNKLVRAFKKIQEGDLNVAVKYRSNDEFSFLYKQFNEMFNQLGTLIEQVYEQKILVQNAELKQLQYQINPHFLYNSILIIYSLVKMDDRECAMKLAMHLGNYYQYITRSSAEEVPLQREIAHAKDYVGIQSIRFSNRIRVEFGDIPPGCENLIVPRLIVQPIIENSFNHGLKDKVRDGALKVEMKQEAGYLGIFIEDNGEEMEEESLARLRQLLDSADPGVERSGLLNVHTRLQIKYGNGSGIFVSRGGSGGLRVEIRISVSVKEESPHV